MYQTKVTKKVCSIKVSVWGKIQSSIQNYGWRHLIDTWSDRGAHIKTDPWTQGQYWQNSRLISAVSLCLFYSYLQTRHSYWKQLVLSSVIHRNTVFAYSCMSTFVLIISFTIASIGTLAARIICMVQCLDHHAPQAFRHIGSRVASLAPTCLSWKQAFQPLTEMVKVQELSNGKHWFPVCKPVNIV